MKQYEQVTKYKKVFKEDELKTVVDKLNEIFSQTDLDEQQLGKAIGEALTDNLNPGVFKVFIKSLENNFNK